MKIATISQLKKELSAMSVEQLVQVCLRIVKHKKESKELLHYLVYESSDEPSYIAAVKEEIEDILADMNKTNLYWAKKTIRKALRTLNKFIRFSGQKQTEVELRLFYCQQIMECGLPIHRSQAMVKLYNRQVAAIEKSLSSLHPDLQFDFQEDLNGVKTFLR